MIVTIFKNIRSCEAPYYRDIQTIIDRIKSGKSKTLVSEIRGKNTKKERDLLKQYLPSICFSGEFTQRNNESLINHSGLICVDFDKFPNMDVLIEHYENIKRDSFTYVSFISPSGDGFKVIVKIPKCKDNKEHNQYFNGLQAYYDNQYFDTVASGLSRVCYESYDPAIYVNNKADVFTDKQLDEGHNIYHKEALFKVTNETDIIKAVDEFWRSKWKFTEGIRNKNMHLLCQYLNEFGVEKAAAMQHVKQYALDDFPEQEIKNVLNSAYRKVEVHNTRFYENDKIVLVVEQMLKESKSKDEIKTYLKKVTIVPDNIDEVIEGIYSNDSTIIFYTKNKNNGIVILSLKYKAFLKQNGFYKYYPEGGQVYMFVRQIGNVYEPVTNEKIKAFVLDYLENNNVHDVYEFMSKKPMFFNEEYLSIIDEVDIKFCKDTKDSAYLFFRNKAIEVTAKKIIEHDYIDLGAFVWKSQVIDRDFKLNQKSIQNDYYTFLKNVSGNNFENLKTVIGYLLHSYKSKSNTKAIILNDEMISDNPEGGTGKGLLVQGIKQLKRLVTEDGKKFKIDKTFAFQKLDVDTQILFIDDIAKGFSFESLFSIITEGIDIEKKNQTTIDIPVERSPKIIISTNYPIKGIGHSFDRRKIEIELNQYYSKNKTPIDEFGRALFDDWNETEFNNFDNFMIGCIHLYMINGLVEPIAHNGKLRKFIASTSPEFLDFIQNRLTFNADRYYKAVLREEFKKEYPDYFKLSEKMFTKWVKYWFQYNDVEFVESSDFSGRYIQAKKSQLDNDPLKDYTLE